MIRSMIVAGALLVPWHAALGQSMTDMSWVHSKAFPGYGLPQTCPPPPKQFDRPSGARRVVLDDRFFRIACNDFYGRRLACANLATRTIYVRGDFVRPQDRLACWRHEDAHINGWRH